MDGGARGRRAWIGHEVVGHEVGSYEVVGHVSWGVNGGAWMVGRGWWGMDRVSNQVYYPGVPEEAGISGLHHHLYEKSWSEERAALGSHQCSQ